MRWGEISNTQYSISNVQVVVLVFLLVSPAAFGADKDTATRLGMRVEPLTYLVSKRAAPLPALVMIQNRAPAFHGVIEARIEGSQDQCGWEQEINVGKGIFGFHVYPQTVNINPDDALLVRVVDLMGRVRAEQNIPLRFKERNHVVISLTEQNRRFTADSFDAEKVSVISIHDSNVLPDQWHGYKAFAAVFWDTLRKDKLEPCQEEALTDWVRTGGRLILGAKKGDTALQSPLPRLIPGLTVVSSEGGAENFIDVKEFPGDSNELFVGKTYGLGSVIFLRVDFSSLNSWPVDDRLRLLGIAAPPPVPPVPIVPMSSRAPGLSRQAQVRSYDTRFYAIPSRLTEVFRATVARMCGYVALNFAPILITMLVYIFVVSVVDYVALKRMRKLPWTWLTFPALIIGFSVLSFFSFYNGRMGSLARNEICFRDIGATGFGRISTVSCIRNNSNRPIEFNTEISHHIGPVGDYESSPYYGYSRRDRDRNNSIFMRVSLKNGKEIRIPGYVGSYRFFSDEWVDRNSKTPFSCELKANAAGIEGNIVNNTGKSVKETFLYYRNRIYDVDNQMRVSGAGKNINSNECLQFLQQYQYSGSSEAPLFTLVSHQKHEPFLLRLAAERDNDEPSLARRVEEYKSIFNIAAKDQAILVAFQQEEFRDGGLPVKRINCIRQIVDVPAVNEIRRKKGDW